MYIPNQYKWRDRKGILSFIQRFNFGLIITISGDRSCATHLPFVVEKRENKLVLISHFAKANPQWEHIESKEVLIVFSEPHSYISPSFYSKKQNVPTWNYLSIQVRGKAKIIKEEKAVFKILEGAIQNFEPSYETQWNTISIHYKKRMVKGIVAFEVEIEDIQAKEKLSQNKTQEERERIIKEFSSSADNHKKILAEFMQKEKD